MSVDETTPSIGTESVEQDDNTSTTADDTDTSVAVDIKEIAASAPVSPSPAPPVESEGMNGKSWSRWLFSRISSVLERNPDHVALVDEVGERRYITYDELMRNVNRAANFLLHHGVQKGDRVAISMSNSVEFIYFELALFLIGAVPILLNPGHVASGRFPRFKCSAVIADVEHYSHVLRSLKNFIGAMQVYVFTNDVGNLHIPRSVWIIDAYGFLGFHCESPWPRENDDSHDEDVVAFSTSGTTSQKSKVVAHGSASAHRLCTEYLNILVAHLVERVSEARTHHLVTSGLHTVDAWSLLMYSLVSDRTLIITESNSDVWAVSSLDRIAELVQLYDVAMIISNAQFIKSFLKYEIHNLYDISSLKVVSYTGSSLPKSVALQFKEVTGASIVEVYSSTEFGPISVNVLAHDDDEDLACGRTLKGISVKITNVDEETAETATGEWGNILLQGPVMCTQYLGDKITGSWTTNNWFRTGDIGMMDKQKRLHVAGPRDVLLKLNDRTVVTVLLENALVAHPCIEDTVVANMNGDLAAGVVVKDLMEMPTIDELNEFIQEKRLGMGPLTKVVQVDFIPRSETGKLMRSEVLFLLQSEDDNRSLKSVHCINKQ